MARSTSRERADLVDRFRHYLQDRRLPRTRQRDRIAEIVFGSDAHPSAADIQRTLAKGDDHVGTATVYRTLELLIASGLVRGHDFGDGYEFSVQHTEPISPRTLAVGVALVAVLLGVMIYFAMIVR